jgi:hypothetical protein
LESNLFQRDDDSPVAAWLLERAGACKKAKGRKYDLPTEAE